MDIWQNGILLALPPEPVVWIVGVVLMVAHGCFEKNWMGLAGQGWACEGRANPSGAWKAAGVLVYLSMLLVAYWFYMLGGYGLLWVLFGVAGVYLPVVIFRRDLGIKG